MRDLFFKLISTQADIAFRNLGIEHTLHVVTFSTLLSKKRKIDTNKAITAAYFHDIAYYTSHYYPDHAKRSRDMMKAYIDDVDILTAISNHSDKATTSNHPLSELIKDADILSHALEGSLNDIEALRYQRILKDLED